MSVRLVRAAARAESIDQGHLARLLLLMRAAGKKSNKPVHGITKLVKLDFLMRYPTCLERALTVLEKNPADAAVESYERKNIESKMIRYRYGPWDARYRRWLSMLVALGLATWMVRGATVDIQLTDAGVAQADDIARLPEFQDTARRSAVIAKAVGDFSGSKLKDFIYAVFPEVGRTEWGEEITV